MINFLAQGLQICLQIILLEADNWKGFEAKGHLISKTNCQAEDSPKKRTNEFVFTTVRRVFVRFLGESSA